MRGVRAVLALLLLLLVQGAAACGTNADTEEETTTLTVFAAASLRAPFEELARAYEAEHTGVKVELSFAGSSDLAAQLEQGASADVFASADTVTMDRVVRAGVVAEDPVPFATNTLQIAVPLDNPAGVTTLADLAGDNVQVVVCAPQVPCGAAAVEVARSAGVELRPVSEEQSVADVLAKVAVGEADAGLVYVTDVLAADDRVAGVPLPEGAEVVSTYPIATPADRDLPDLARDFVELVTGPTGRAVLDDAGFASP